MFLISVFRCDNDPDVRAAPVIDSGTHEYIALLTTGDGLDAILGAATGALDTMTIGAWLTTRSSDGRLAPLRVVDANDSLLSVCAVMRDDAVDRVPIVSDRMVLCVLNYGRILRFLHSHLGARADRHPEASTTLDGLSSRTNSQRGSDVRLDMDNVLDESNAETRLLSLTLAQLRLGVFDDVTTVRETDKLRDVLRLLKERDLRAIPVVNDVGELTNVYARSDVALLACAEWGTATIFDLSVREVLNRVRQPFFTLATCRPADTLATIFRRFEVSRRHRLYITDDNRHVIGVLTLSDLLRYFLEGY